MTKSFFSSSARVQTLLLALLSVGVLPAVQAQSQGLRPSAQLRATPAAPAASRQADYIVAVVNSEPITNSELRAALIRTEQQMVQQGAPMPPRRPAPAA